LARICPPWCLTSYAFQFDLMIDTIIAHLCDVPTIDILSSLYVNNLSFSSKFTPMFLKGLSNFLNFILTLSALNVCLILILIRTAGSTGLESDHFVRNLK